MLRPEEDVGDYSDLIRHRATSRPAARKPYSAAALDELLALPDFADELGYDRLEQTQRKGPLAGGRVMDATARMFLKGKTEEEPPARQEPRRSHRRGQDASVARKTPQTQTSRQEQQPKQAKPSKQRPQESRKDDGQQAAQPSRRQRRSNGKGQNSQAPQPRAAAVLEQSKLRNSRPTPHSGKGKRRTDAPPEKTAAAESKSLIRPYYLTDTRGKRG
ncbi:MAG: hypothetical protein LIO45_03445 [Clostridiales bacterium]|nr:hypothetical protein [Clostridiales bacterium]